MPSSCNEKKNEAKQMCDLEAIQKQAHTHFAKAIHRKRFLVLIKFLISHKMLPLYPKNTYSRGFGDYKDEHNRIQRVPMIKTKLYPNSKQLHLCKIC